MKLWVAPVALALFVAGSPCACSLVTSLNGLTGGVADAGSEVDATSEGGADGCADGSLFCDDFERGDLLGPWTSPTISQGSATASIVSDDGTNGSLRSLESAIVHGTATSDARAYLTKAFDISPEHALLEYDLKIVTMPPDSFFNVGGLRVGYAGGYGILQLSVHSAKVALSVVVPGPDAGNIVDEVPIMTPSLGTWFRVRFELDFSQSPAQANLLVDNKPAATRSLPAAFQRGKLDVYAGIIFSGTPQDGAIRVDNLVVQAR